MSMLENPPLGRSPPWSIYADEQFHHGYGYPLWMPDPDPSASEVQIGDVGWLSEGGFYQLFNAMKEEGEPQLRDTVPVGYEPLATSNDILISGPRAAITQQFLCGRSVRQVEISTGASGSLLAPTVSAGARYGFKCSADSGAFLMLAPPALSTQIQSKRRIVNYMLKHHERWLELANTRFELDLKLEEIIFVSGVTKTSRWAVAAFQGEYKMKEGSVSADLASLAGVDLNVTISNEVLPSSYFRVGPPRGALEVIESESSAGGSSALRLSIPSRPTVERKHDQCIFMHYYKMKKKLWLYSFPKRAAAGEHKLPRDPDDGLGPATPSLPAALSRYDELESDADVFDKPFDPVDALLDYILENSDASVAIASDLDVYAIVKDREALKDIKLYLGVIGPAINVGETGVGTLSMETDEREALSQAGDAWTEHATGAYHFPIDIGPPQRSDLTDSWQGGSSVSDFERPRRRKWRRWGRQLKNRVARLFGTSSKSPTCVPLLPRPYWNRTRSQIAVNILFLWIHSASILTTETPLGLYSPPREWGSMIFQSASQRSWSMQGNSRSFCPSRAGSLDFVADDAAKPDIDGVKKGNEPRERLPERKFAGDDDKTEVAGSKR